MLTSTFDGARGLDQQAFETCHNIILPNRAPPEQVAEVADEFGQLDAFLKSHLFLGEGPFRVLYSATYTSRLIITEAV